MFALGDDQLAFRDMARDFARERLAPQGRRMGPDQAFPGRRAARGGGARLRRDLRFGEEWRLGPEPPRPRRSSSRLCPRGARPSRPISRSTTCVPWMIEQYGSDAQRAHWLPKLCSMETLTSYCLTEAGHGSDAAALRTRADREANGFVLNGTKQFISGAGAADLYVGHGAGREGAVCEGHLRVPRREGGRGPVVWRQRKQDGLERPTRRGR